VSIHAVRPSDADAPDANAVNSASLLEFRAIDPPHLNTVRVGRKFP
jgi:hypothetical protein